MISEEQFITAICAALDAGRAIMNIYKNDFPVEYKKDNSPLTQADKNAHDIIATALSPMGYPVLSEEGKEISYAERSMWKEFWLVDPLDGTREFIKRNGEFTVNIAFIKDGKSIAGIIYAPVLEKLYFAKAEYGSRMLKLDPGYATILTQQNILQMSVALPVLKSNNAFVVASSVSHLNDETKQFIEQAISGKENVEYLQIGSSLKFCALAEGSVDLYPRMGPTMEWDTAAGQAIAEYAGCIVKNFNSGEPMAYNKPSLLNPWFVAER